MAAIQVGLRQQQTQIRTLLILAEGFLQCLNSLSIQPVAEILAGHRARRQLDFALFNLTMAAVKFADVVECRFVIGVLLEGAFQMPDGVIRALVININFAQSTMGINIVRVDTQNTPQHFTGFRITAGFNQGAPQRPVGLHVTREILQNVPRMENDFGSIPRAEQVLQFGGVLSQAEISHVVSCRQKNQSGGSLPPTNKIIA